ncbi:MAG: Ig-like domain-containing protein [Trueperaceae bacterium]
MIIITGRRVGRFDRRACSWRHGARNKRKILLHFRQDPFSFTNPPLHRQLDTPFDRAMDQGATEAAFDAPADVDCSFSWNADGTELTCDPTDAFDPSTGYAFGVGTGAQSADGDALGSAASFTFTTRPAVESTQPADGASDVPRNAPIQVTFSGAMDTAATEAAIGIDPAVDCDVRWSAGNDRWTCVPQTSMDATTTYQVTVASDATDAAGAQVGTTTSFTFTTGTAELADCAFGVTEFGSCLVAP